MIDLSKLGDETLLSDALVCSAGLDIRVKNCLRNLIDGRSHCPKRRELFERVKTIGDLKKEVVFSLNNEGNATLSFENFGKTSLRSLACSLGVDLPEKNKFVRIPASSFPRLRSGVRKVEALMVARSS